MDIQYIALSETGSKMKENQDRLFCGVNGGTGIFVLADGMGGHQNGSHASTVITQKAAKWWEQYLRVLPRPGFFDAVEALKELFSEANQEIYQNTEKGSICGATLLALWLDRDTWVLFSCGDSRCYQARYKMLKKDLIQLTTDDVWENQSDNINGLSREQIKSNQNYGCLVKAVGVKPGFHCSVQRDRCQRDMLFVLCSDGIYKYCPDMILKKSSFYALRSGNLEEAAQHIREKVFQNGAGDNLSLILVRIGKTQSIR